jgi:hypothetical protein
MRVNIVLNYVIYYLCIYKRYELPARLNGQRFLHFIMYDLPVLLENVPLEEQESIGLC